MRARLNIGESQNLQQTYADNGKFTPAIIEA